MQEKIKQLRGDIALTLQGMGGLDKLIAYCEVTLLSVLVLGLVAAELWSLFVASHTWLKQLFKYLVIWIGLLGASLATQSGDHISITVIPSGTDSPMHRAIRIVVNLASAVVTLLMALAACQYISYEKATWQSGRAPGTDPDVCKLYLPTHPLSVMERQSAELDRQNQARLALLLGAQGDKAWEEWSQELAQVSVKMQERQSSEQQKNNWKQEWLRRHWQEWQPRMQQAWVTEGEKAWQQLDRRTLAGDNLKWFRLKWQEEWIAARWQQQWQAACEEEWQRHGKNSVPAGEDESEFAKAWQAQWIKRMWQQQGRAHWESAWQQEGIKAYFRKQWSEAWLLSLWQREGSVSWQQVASLPHHGTFVKPANMEQYQESGWNIPRWILLLILPVSLFIITFRFVLRGLGEIFVANEGKA